jgi:hypothetical protein
MRNDMRPYTKESTMKSIQIALVAGALVVLAASAHSQAGSRSFSIQPVSVKGFPTGEVKLTGGGQFDPFANTSRSGGGFRCLADVNQGPLAGLRAGEGIRWDVDQVLPSTAFKCSGAASEPLKTAFTGGNTVVFHADFYRAGDGIHESFQANMIVSSDDLDPDLPGIQTVWVQGVGCGETGVEFR